MRIQYLSDLHVDFRPYTFQVDPAADVIVVAGDIANLGLPNPRAKIKRPVDYCRKIFEELSKTGKHIISVPGNHCYYGMDLANADIVVREAYGHGLPNVHILMDESVVINGVRFFGSALWPSMDWFGKATHRQHSPITAVEFNNFFMPRAIQDFHVVRCGGRPLIPDDYRERHRKTVDELVTLCNTTPPDVVVTHFGPTRLGIHPKFADNALNPFFANDLNMKDFRGVKLWIHGHTHECISYEVEGIRVRCNPRGYPGEDNGFNPLATEEV